VPADTDQIVTLARKLRGKGLDDAQVTDSLTGLGFTKTQAKGALSSLDPTAKPVTRQASTGGAPRPSSRGTTTPTKTTAPAPVTGPAPAPAVTMPSLPTPDLSRLTLTPPKKLNGGDVGGFLAGLGLYALALNYLRHGPDGVKGWMAAKFLNRPASLAVKLPPKSPTPSATAPGGGGEGGGGSWRAMTSTRPTKPTNPQQKVS
jgi:hypothetical protein